MVNLDTLRTLALSFPEATEAPHFEKTSFRVKKKIFATYDDKLKRVCIKLSEIDQDVYGLIDATMIYPVNNKWGKQGWTLIELEKVSLELLKEALIAAYCEVAPASLAAQLKSS